MTARYARAPSPTLLRLLADGGLLAPMRTPATVAGVALDLQLREGDQVDLYAGLTKLVQAQARDRGVVVSAADTYTRQACAGALFRTWRPDEPGFAAALRGYLAGVHVDPRWVHKEGAVQAAWMAVERPWVALDREAVLGRASTAARAAALDVPAVNDAFDAVRALAEAGGSGKSATPGTSNELDQLAVDPAGRLVLVELKDARSVGVATAPLQVLRYALEWHAAIATVLPELQALLAAKRALGLVPADTPALTGALRVAVAWGDGQPSDEVYRRMIAVKREVDRRVPPGVGAVEVWGLAGGVATRAA